MIRLIPSSKVVRGSLAVVAILCLAPMGCNKTQSTQGALDAQLSTLNMKREPLGKVAGTVTIDGQPPTFVRGKAMLVMLYNQKDPEKNKHPLYTAVKKNGKFSFFTYVPDDGVPLGSYTVLFAELSASRAKGLIQPDGLKNLYDDPDKNSQNKEFQVTVTQPGRTDYEFNLQVAGKDAAAPGEHAIKEIRKD
jgi:hypothetical protein